MLEGPDPTDHVYLQFRPTHGFFINFLFVLEPLSPVLISDCDKGRGSVLDELGLGANSIHLHCCQHIKENTVQKCGASITLNKYFWNIARATTPTKFDYHMKKLREISASAAEYLEGIDSTTWAEAYVPVSRFGHDTSNVVESITSCTETRQNLTC